MCIHTPHTYTLKLHFSTLITLQLHDYTKTPGETDVQFRLTKVTLEPMLKSMTYISQQLSAPANRVAVINLKVSSVNF